MGKCLGGDDGVEITIRVRVGNKVSAGANPGRGKHAYKEI